MTRCTTSRFSRGMFLGLLDCLCGSLEQSAPTRAKAPLLMKAMLEKVANEDEARNRAEKYAQDKTVKVVSDMPMMKP